MKRSQILLLLIFIVSMLVFSSCMKPATSANGPADNTQNNQIGQNSQPPKDPNAAKTTGAFPAVPPVIMNTEMKSLDGKTFKIKDFEGKVVLVNLWAIWCGPCRMEMPELVKIEEEYKDKGVMVIGLDVDPEPEEAVKNFVERQKLNYMIGWAEDEVKESMVGISRMNGIPQSFLISPDGRLAAVFKGYDREGFAPRVRAAIDDVLTRKTE